MVIFALLRGNVKMISHCKARIFYYNSSMRTPTIALIVLAASLTVCACSGSYGPGTYQGLPAVYIDPDAGGGGDGSYDSPYKYWADVPFKSGTAYLQKRGTIAREQVTLTASGTADKPVILSAYGSGASPIIQGTETITGWASIGSNIYRKAMGTAQVGIVLQNGNPLTYLAWNTDAATTFAASQPGSFAFDPAAMNLYVRCSGIITDPAFYTMEASTRYFGIQGTGMNYVTIENFTVRWTSLHGMQFIDSSSVVVRNCAITRCGGAWLGSFAAGNGVEFGNSAVNCTVKDCTITDIFDSGVTVQTYANNAAASNIVFQNNVIDKCGFAGIEIAVLPGFTNDVVSAVTVSGNFVTNAGRGWSGDRSGEGNGIKVISDATGTISGVSIEGSSISASKGRGIYLAGNVGIVTISRTKVQANAGGGISLVDANPSSLKLYLASSLVYSNSGYGVSFNVPFGQGFQVYQNTFYNNGPISFAVFGHSGTADMRNNIFSSSTPTTHFYSVALTGPVIDHNDYHENGANIIGYGATAYTTVANFRSATLLEQHGIGSDPILTGPSSGDLTLQSISPCKLKGDNTVGVVSDYSGVAFGNPPSIGAFQ